MRVLAVDDDSDLLELYRLVLEMEEGWRVDFARSGAAALKLCTDRSYDLILLDLVMPGLDGVATLRKLREAAARETPVVCITSRMRQGEVSSLLALGVAGVIPKPVDPTTLVRDLKRLL